MLSKPKSPPSLGRSADDVRLDAEQVANRIRVLGAIEPMHGRGAGVRIRRGGRVERALERCDELVAHVGIGLRLLARRHRSNLELAQHLFPDRGIGVDVVEARPLERQLAP